MPSSRIILTSKVFKKTTDVEISYCIRLRTRLKQEHGISLKLT